MEISVCCRTESSAISELSFNNNENHNKIQRQERSHLLNTIQFALAQYSHLSIKVIKKFKYFNHNLLPQFVNFFFNNEKRQNALPPSHALILTPYS